jgi:hypothetical protein
MGRISRDSNRHGHLRKARGQPFQSLSSKFSVRLEAERLTGGECKVGLKSFNENRKSLMKRRKEGSEKEGEYNEI